MIAFIIKSTISLLVIYVLYKVFLAKENIPVFKRYFLLFGVLFSIGISFVSIKTGFPIPDTMNQAIISSHINEISYLNPQIRLSDSDNSSYIKWIFSGIYFLVFISLLFRYISNIAQLINQGKNNRSYPFEGYTIVVLDHLTLPFSFLNTIYISDKDCINGVIKKEILIHELAHIKQKHSIDILCIEFLQVVCWFNPFIWLYKKEIRLNHEYLADKQVLDFGINRTDYQNFILNFAFRNNSSYLASNFNYSFIKKRFIMLAKEKSSKRVFMKGIVIVPAIILLAIVMSFNQSVMAIDKDNEQAEWWQPILQKHNVKEIKSYNNIGPIFEMGDNNSIQNDVCSLTNATMIIKGNDNDYLFIQAALIEHNIKDGTLRIKSGKMKTYKIDSNLAKPSVVMEGDIIINVNDIIKSNLFH